MALVFIERQKVSNGYTETHGLVALIKTDWMKNIIFIYESALLHVRNLEQKIK